MKINLRSIPIEESQRIFSNLIYDCVLQSNNSYLSNNGRLIWNSLEVYQLAHISKVPKMQFKSKTTTKRKVSKSSKSGKR